MICHRDGAQCHTPPFRDKEQESAQVCMDRRETSLEVKVNEGQLLAFPEVRGIREEKELPHRGNVNKLYMDHQ